MNQQLQNELSTVQKEKDELITNLRKERKERQVWERERVIYTHVYMYMSCFYSIYITNSMSCIVCFVNTTVIVKICMLNLLWR